MMRTKVGFDTIVESRPTKSGGVFFQQSVWVFTPGAEYPIKINLIIPREVGQSGGYPVGEYLLDLDSSFDQGSFKSADIGFSQKLIPFSEEVYQRKIQLLQSQMQEQLKAHLEFVAKSKSFADSQSVVDSSFSKLSNAVSSSKFKEAA